MSSPLSTSMIIVFDTRCILCSRWVQFLLSHEADDRIHFIGAWSRSGLEIAARCGRSKADLERSYLVIAGSRTLDRSDAGLELLRHLKTPWRWLRLLRFVPRPLRDGVYDIVARNRYAWFGKTDQCLVPSAASRHRFTLD